jgi:hypothetical protein
MEPRANENPVARDICIQVIEPIIWDKDITELKKKMPIKYARQIKQWRVGDGPDDLNTHSWRSVATMFCNTYPEFSEEHNIISGNQISGMYLCDAAMVKLKEQLNQGWN